MRRAAFSIARRGVCAALCTAAAALVAPLFGQTTSAVFTAPWTPEPHWADTFDDLLFFGDTDTKGAGEKTDVFYWDSRGRIKFLRDDPDPAFVLGYKILTYDSRSDNRLIGGQLNDIALAGATHVDGLIGGWRVNVMGGAGTANDGYFRNRESWYPTAALGGQRRLGETGLFHAGIEFDGSRVLWPDVPLPYVSYRDSLGKRVRYAVGIPETSVTVRPLDGMSLDLRYYFPVKLDATAEYELADWLRIFALYGRTLEGFSMGAPNRDRIDLGKDQRFFHEFDRAGGGLRLVTSWLDASLGGGWAFNHRFLTGWDLRDLDEYRDLEGGWYVALRVQGTF